MTALLVANRGEIARRIFRSARRMGIRCIAVYSDADAGAAFVAEADEAIRIGPAPAGESYLRIDRMIGAAKETHAGLVHPGYGFLAEDAEFAEACEAAGLTFVGPPPETLRLLGSKHRARALAEQAGVPVAPGYSGEDQRDGAFLEAASAIGYPVIVKPASGGGGKGMAVVTSAADLPNALHSARRIADASFGEQRLLIERYVVRGRHLEVQIIGDSFGKLLHLGERDCSLQRRHQKVLEEAPASGISEELRQSLRRFAVDLARHAGYRNAGTAEFVVSDDETPAFLEVNARLQVEHPVTEVTAGVDLVEMQLRVAMGERLEPPPARPRGHAVEARLYAEDPAQEFLPQAGEVLHLRWPRAEGVRIDSGIEEGGNVPAYYDPMLGKVIAWGADRTEAWERLRLALADVEVLGVGTNLEFLRAIAGSPEVAAGALDNSWLEEGFEWQPARPLWGESARALAAAAHVERAVRLGSAGRDPWGRLGPWRGGAHRAQVVIAGDGGEEVLEVRGTTRLAVSGHSFERGEKCHDWFADGEPASAAPKDDRWFVMIRGEVHEVEVGPRARGTLETGAAHLEAPMPGQVIMVSVSAGDRVSRGDELVVVEAMKMEHRIRAPADGVIGAVLCTAGQQVDRGQTLVDFEPD